MRRIAGAGISFFGGLWWRRAGRGQFCCASGAGPAPRWRDTLQTARFLMVGLGKKRPRAGLQSHLHNRRDGMTVASSKAENQR
jgi:hypothetical protein